MPGSRVDLLKISEQIYMIYLVEPNNYFNPTPINLIITLTNNELVNIY